MKIKYIAIISIASLIIISMILVFIDNKKSDAVEPINCETIVPMYFKPSELAIAAKMKSTKNIIAVIPEENMILARTEVLECPNFDYRDYVKI